MPSFNTQICLAVDTPLLEAARWVVQRLQEAGHDAFFVGGFARNRLLDKPVEDVDIATAAHPEEVAELFERTRAVGAHFGVTLVSVDEWDFEVATFRAEGSYVDRRHPSEVRYGTLEEDFQRRDFTINAMYYDPVNERLIDPAGGRRDLERRRLRTVGEPHRRFDEDALRIMRAVRFAVRYELTIERETAEALAELSPTLAEISPERVSDELLRILTGPHPGDAMHRMSELRIWPVIMPEIEAMHGVEQPPNFHPEGDVFIHTALVLDHAREGWLEVHDGPPPAVLMLGALLHDVGKPVTFERAEDRIRFPEHADRGAEMALEIGRRLRLSRRIIEGTADLVAQHMRFMDVQRMRQSTLRRFLGQGDFELHLLLHRADCLGSHGKIDNYHFCLQMQKELAQQDAQAALLPDPLVSGHDLLAMGLEPGPKIGELLEAVREEQLEGRIENRDEALNWLREQLAHE